MGVRLLTLRVLVTGVLGVLPVSASAYGAAEPGLGGRAALDQLNAQRAANGIPAGITFDDNAAAGCRLHANWMTLNGKLQHDEPSGTPGYTEAGDRAGNSSVLGGTWAQAGAGPFESNPYENAPIHLMQLLGPKLSTTGIWGPCASTWPGYQRPDPSTPVIHTYPGDGTTGIYASETAFESPLVPGDLVGLPMGTETGPHLFVLAEGLSSGSLTAATLTGPGGAVDVRTVDNQTSQLGGYLPPGGIIIPTKPLSPGRYTASAVFNARPRTGPGGDFDYVSGGSGSASMAFPVRWSFTAVQTKTSGSSRATPPARRTGSGAVKARFRSIRTSGGYVVVRVRVPAAGTQARVTLRLRFRRLARCRVSKCKAPIVVRTGRLRRGEGSYRIKIPSGRWRATVQLTGVSNAGFKVRLPTSQTVLARR